MNRLTTCGLAAFSIFLLSAASSLAATRTWTGAGTNANASTAGNWTDTTAPVSGDHIVIDNLHLGNARTNVTWNLNIVVASWTQTTNYAGTVTIQTRYPGQGAFNNLEITGNCAISNGIWTHPVNTGGATAIDRLAVTVGGDFVLGSGATIDVTGRGYAPYQGPGAGVSGQRSQASHALAKAASHGGVGSYATFPGSKCYGSLTAPEMLGSGSTENGGGSARLLVAGCATINGIVRANAETSGSFQRPASAGGSIYIKAGTVVGNGHLEANGMQAYWPGGGGRIALIVTNSTSFGNITCSALQGIESPTSHGGHGAPGTIYLETMADGPKGPGGGRVIVNPQGRERDQFTELPPLLAPPDEIRATLILTNLAYVSITTNCWMGDLFIGANSASRLYLNGFDLNLKAEQHDSWGTTNKVVYNGGEIIWSVRGGVVIIF